MLRDGTAKSHNRIDRRLGALDLTSVEGLSKLLGVHYLVRSLYAAKVQSGEAEDPFLSALESDLNSLAISRPIWGHTPTRLNYHPLGYRYVMAGSQLGARLLHRQWSAATNATVCSAGQFLHANVESRDWPILLGEMNAIRVDDAEQADILVAANRVFGLFDRAADELGIDPAGHLH